AKFLFALIIEAAGYLIFTLLTVVRLVFLAGAGAYTKNPMMNANAAFLGYVAMIFAAYNYFFIGGFFKTSYKIGKPFLIFSGVTLTIILIAEVLHHIPGLEMLNATAGINAPQAVILIAGVILYAAGTLCSYNVSVKRFEKTDL
nr:ABC-2 transporter permease [Oscillospiraceae bacterium]